MSDEINEITEGHSDYKPGGRAHGFCFEWEGDYYVIWSRDNLLRRFGGITFILQSSIHQNGVLQALVVSTASVGYPLICSFHPGKDGGVE